ncbi:MAG: hypothetical protein QM736_26325 [Vicinamibacterales bacterium]
MRDNRCPNCKNDITSTVNAAIIAMIDDEDRAPRPIACPHCDESLVVSAQIASSLDLAATVF